MPTVSARSKIRRIKERIRPDCPAVNLALEVRGVDKQPVLYAGGAWHSRKLGYVESSEPAHVVNLVSSQMKAARQLAEWFEEYERDEPNRTALEIYVDNRRGGKTFFSVLALLLFALRYPACHLGKTVCWLVVPTFPQQRELHEVFTKLVPAAWFRDGRIVYRKSEKYYTLANGAEIWIKSADRPHSLKAGGVAAVVINEAQQIDSRGILNAMGANIDSGGICWLAMNPPDSVKALWAQNIHDAVNAVDDDGNPVIPWARETGFPAERNEVINQEAKTRFGEIAKIIDPLQAKRDASGIWTAITDQAYPLYRREQHFRPEPVGWQDITLECNNFTGMGGRLNKKGQPWARSLGAGMDFQRKPWCAYIEAKAYKAPVGLAWIAPGTIVYVVNREITNDPMAGDWWTEELLCMKVAEDHKRRKIDPSKFLLIADRTGKQQGSEQASRGPQADPETFSWPIVQRFGWDPHAPIEDRTITDPKRGAADIETKFSNPPVSVRLNMMNEILRSNRLIISTSCPQTAEGFRKCEVHKESRKPKGHDSHLTDAVGYLLFAWESALREHGLVRLVG